MAPLSALLSFNKHEKNKISTSGWGKTLDIVASSIIYTCDVNITWNNILIVPWCHWFFSPVFHLWCNRLDTKKTFFIPNEKFFFIIRVHLWSTDTTWNLDCLVNYNFIVYRDFRVRNSISPKVIILQTNIKIPHIFLI